MRNLENHVFHSNSIFAQVISRFPANASNINTKDSIQNVLIEISIDFYWDFQPEIFFHREEKKLNHCTNTTEQKVSNERCECWWKHLRRKEIHSIDSEKNSEVSSEKKLTSGEVFFKW